VTWLGRAADASLDALVAPGFSRIGLAVRSALLPGFTVGDYPRIDGRTVVRRRPGIQCSLSRDGQTSALKFGARSLDLPSSLASTLEFIAGHRSFCADSLPGRLSGDAKLKLVKRLLRDGFLVLDDDEGSGES